MQLFTIGIFTVLIGCNFGSRPSESAKEIIGVNVMFTVPAFNREGSILYQSTDSFQVYYWGDRVLYQVPYYFDSSVNGAIVKTERRNSFFVFKKNDQYGCKQDLAKGCVALPVDSMTNTPLGNLNLYPLLNTPNVTLVSSGQNGATLQEVYVRKHAVGNASDSAFFYFSKDLRTVDFSLSEELDSIKGLKLYKVRIVSAAQSILSGTGTLTPSELAFELKRTPITNAAEIVTRFNACGSGCKSKE